MRRGLPNTSRSCMECWLGQMIPRGVEQAPVPGVMFWYEEGIVLQANNLASRESISGCLS